MKPSNIMRFDSFLWGNPKGDMGLKMPPTSTPDPGAVNGGAASFLMAVSVDLLSFWRQNPEVWFLQSEAQSEAHSSLPSASKSAWARK
jgi:hypothetical protein